MVIQVGGWGFFLKTVPIFFCSSGQIYFLTLSFLSFFPGDYWDFSSRPFFALNQVLLITYSMAKVGIKTSFSSVKEEQLRVFVDRFFPGKIDSFRLPGRNQSIVSPPDGYIGVYLKSFSMGNVRFPFSPFLIDVLKYYDNHFSLMHPQGHSKIMAFEVMCRAYGGVPTVYLFRRFAYMCDAGEWVTIANRPNGGCFLKGGVDIRAWKDKFVYMSVELLPQGCEVLTDVSKLEKIKKNIDPLPDEEGTGWLYDEILRSPIVVLSYPEGILFKARVVSSLPAGEDELDGKGCIFWSLSLLQCI